MRSGALTTPNGARFSTAARGASTGTVQFRNQGSGPANIYIDGYYLCTIQARDRVIVRNVIIGSTNLRWEYLDGRQGGTRCFNLRSCQTYRFTFRPQLVVVHNRGPWSFEATAIASLYTDNDEFFDGNELEQDAFYTLEGHVVYTFRPGLWVGAGAGYGYGGESTVNGKGKGDRKDRKAQASRMHHEEQLSLAGHDRITTEIELASPFYYAEEKHQQYLAKYQGG